MSIGWSALAILIALIAGYLLGATITNLRRDWQQMRAELEAVRQKRHTHPTAAGIEDATAVALDLSRQIREAKLEFDALEQRIDQQREILALVRQGPYAYDPERPAGQRPQGRSLS